MSTIRISTLLVMALLLVACNATQSPQLIAAAPRNATPRPIAQYPPENLVYNGYLELQVIDADSTAERVKQIAYDHGGYLLSAQAWNEDGRREASVAVVVPAGQFEATRQSLRAVGTLVSETVTSSPGDPYAPGTNSQITVHLIGGPVAPATPEPPGSGWNPGRTFGQAFGVTSTIFGFLGDIAIWLIVVVGPFALIGALVYLALRRAARRAS